MRIRPFLWLEKGKGVLMVFELLSLVQHKGIEVIA